MKGLVLILVFSLVFFGQTFGNAADTTVTSFEIRLKRNQDPFGFNTCNIDRAHIYELVTDLLSEKFSGSSFKSIHDPYVLLKFTDVDKAGKSNRVMSTQEKKLLKTEKYSHFVKIFGDFDIDKPFNQYYLARLSLTVYIFDSEGKLIKKSKARSKEKYFPHAERTMGDVPTSINESQFFDLVDEAAHQLEIAI